VRASEGPREVRERSSQRLPGGHADSRTVNLIARAMPSVPATGDLGGALLAALRDGIVIIAGDGRILQANERLFEMTGFGPEDLIGALPPYPLWPPEEAESLAADLRTSLVSGGSFEVILQRSTGERFPALVDVSAIAAEGDGVLFVVRDLSAQAQDRRRLVASEARLRDAQRIARIADWEWDPQTDRVTASPALACSIGITPEQPIALGQLLAFVQPPFREQLRQGILSARDGGGEFFLRCPVDVPGTVTWIDARAWTAPGSPGVVRGTCQDVSDQARALLAVERAGDFHQATLDSLDDHVAVLNAHGTILMTNRAWERFAAENGGRDVGIGANYLDACAAPGDPSAGAVASALREILAGERDAFRMEYACHGPDQERWFVLLATRYRGGGPKRVVVTHRDVTSRKDAEHEAQVRARLLDEVDAAVIATDLDGTVTHWNSGAEQMYGWTLDEAAGRPITGLIVGPDDAPVAFDMMESVQASGRWQGEVEAYRRDDSHFPAYLRTAGITDQQGVATGIVGVSVDLTERVRAARELRSARDYLRAVTDSMGEGLLVNDEEGCLTYLNESAERMLGWSMEALAGQDTHKVLHHRRPDGSPMPYDDCPILHCRRDGLTVRVDDESFVRADGSMLPVSYTAAPFETPEGVRGSVVIFSDASARRAEEQRVESELEALGWLTRIRDALDNGRFVLHAQPIIDIVTGKTVQHELLIRMVDEDGSAIPPGVFLPIAEEYGLIREIDRWVIGQGAALAAEGHPIEINLSAESLGDPDLYSVVERELEAHGTDPSLIVFELTETALLREEEAACTFIERVEKLGCKLALDDFGTGYGGFTYLKRLPVHYLKIDIEFVRDLPLNTSSQHVVRAVVSLAHSFGQQTVAEGVEDDATLEFLRELGVDFAQGYGIGRPAPVRDVLPR
jgi:PAS domain S-box-containing protein